MPISPARIAAFDILLRVEREDSYASELLHSSRYADFSSADHGLATELVMGVLAGDPCWTNKLQNDLRRRLPASTRRFSPRSASRLTNCCFWIVCPSVP